MTDWSLLEQWVEHQETIDTRKATTRVAVLMTKHLKHKLAQRVQRAMEAALMRDLMHGIGGHE